jgi:hypothetical protein
LFRSLAGDKQTKALQHVSLMHNAPNLLSTSGLLLQWRY